ncbi:tetraacyldisaccharide 4'-kinase [Campylobacter sp. CN_NA2]|uniref:tetraacyldisaccharide 4'-kinase n=1 Tax=unclassified Campylobacter TaxID=2593542 RepID=UPI003FCD8AB5
MFNKFALGIEKFLWKPSPFGAVLAIFLLPLSALYSLIVCLKKLFAKPQDFKIPIISVGNLTLGGSGKTPLCKAIFNKFSSEYKIFIILRGYARKSKGMILVCDNGEILCDTTQSGDEAMEYALALNNANVIVSEDRKIAIEKAKQMGANLILLDDGFGKFDILKFDILLLPRPLPTLPFTIPSSAYRYPLFFAKFADFIPADGDIFANSQILNPTKNMILVSAIAKPWRLKEFFAQTKAQIFYPDHYDFKKDELENLLKIHNATSLLITEKDYAKIKNFDLPTSIIRLNLTLSENFKDKIKSYIKQNLIE